MVLATIAITTLSPVSASHSTGSEIVSASGMNSCGGWYHTSGTFLNYCPQCGAHGSLSWNPKGVPEGEWTCMSCDADYCICGHCKGHNGAGLIHATKKKVVKTSPVVPVQQPKPPTPIEIVKMKINEPMIVLSN